MASVYAERLESIAERARLRREDVARVVGASPRTVARWAQGESGPRAEARDRLLELSAVVNELSKVVRAEAAEAWLFAPNPLLDFERPLDLVQQGDYRKVIAAIEGLADGVFV